MGEQSTEVNFNLCAMNSTLRENSVHLIFHSTMAALNEVLVCSRSNRALPVFKPSTCFIWPDASRKHGVVMVRMNELGEPVDQCDSDVG